MRKPGCNWTQFQAISSFLECPRALWLLCEMQVLGTLWVCKHNLQLGCLDPEFRCLDTSSAWYVSNLQVDEGSSDDQAGEVNTHHYILQCYFVQKPKNVIYFLSKHSCQGTYLLGGWQKPRAERMRSHSKVTLFALFQYTMANNFTFCSLCPCVWTRGEEIPAL